MPDIAELDLDLYEDAALQDPYPLYQRMRDASAVVYLPKHGFYALSRFNDVKQALANWKTFSSANGVAMNEHTNTLMAGTVIASDPPDHTRLRKILERPISPKEVVGLRQRITELAGDLLDRLAGRSEFDAVSELARYLPVTVVSELVGLPEEGRQSMLRWAAASFDIMAPAETRRAQQAGPIMAEMMDYIYDPSLPRRLRPGGWAQRLFDAADQGELEPDQPLAMIQGYLNPSLDTTIFAMSNLVWLFAKNPYQWLDLRENPGLVSRAINEAIRLESPLQHFSRFTTQDVTVDGCHIPANSRVLVMYAAANRDERHYENPEGFDIRRDNGDHLGFGHSDHKCVGMNLAKLELTALVEAMLKHIVSFELVEEKRAMNSLLRGFETLKIRPVRC